jgi:hypothetical protein
MFTFVLLLGLAALGASAVLIVMFERRSRLRHR